MNCFSNVEKWFMNQKEKCSPKRASINNDFYSWIHPWRLLSSGRTGWNHRIPVEVGVRDKLGGKGWEIGEVAPETAAVGSGCDG